MITIAGIDASITGSGIVKYYLDDECHIIESDYRAFCKTKKHCDEKVIFCKKEQFANDLERFFFIGHQIRDFISDCDYIAFEDYAFNATGRVFNIGEFTGNLKLIAWKLGAKLQFYDPNSIKMYATTKGGANKIQMKEAYDMITNCDFKPDLSLYPKVATTKGISPTSDIVDAFFICDLLLTEIMLRKGILAIADLDEASLRVFNRTTAAHPTNILSRELIRRDKI